MWQDKKHANIKKICSRHTPSVWPVSVSVANAQKHARVKGSAQGPQGQGTRARTHPRVDSTLVKPLLLHGMMMVLRFII